MDTVGRYYVGSATALAFVDAAVELEEGHPPFIAHRFFIRAKYSTIRKYDHDNMIQDIWPVHWFDFPKYSLVTYEDVSSMLRDMNIFDRIMRVDVSNYFWEASSIQSPLKDGDDMVCQLVKSLNSHIDHYVKEFHNFTINFHVRHVATYSSLDSFRNYARLREGAVKRTLNDLAALHQLLNRGFDDLSKGEWISKIHHTLSHIEIYFDRATLGFMADMVMSMIRDKSCKICLEDIEFRTPFLIAQSCKHVFHRNCVIKLGDNIRCPICYPS